jgi:phage terminase large subunit
VNFNETLLAARDNIFTLCKVLNYVPTTQQADLLKRVQDHTFARRQDKKKGIAGKSGQGPGKTSATTVAVTWRNIQAIDEQSIVTAPTMRQAKKVWMSELSRTIGRADPNFQKLVKIDAGKAVFLGRKDWVIDTATSAKAANLQGYHSPGLTIVADEASGLARGIWQTIKGTLTGPNNLLVAIGNPNDRETEFFDMFNKDCDLYDTFTWSAEDSPNVSKKHIADMEAEYGRESDVFRVRVLGEFPRQNPMAVIRYEDLQWCATKVPFDRAFQTILPGEPESGTRQFGIDLARFGSDESVISVRYNAAMLGRQVFNKKEPSEVIEAAFAWQKRLGWSDEQTLYCCDAGGMGQGVLSMFYEANKNVFEFHSQGSATDGDMYFDAITEAYFVFRMLTKSRQVKLLQDAQTFNQLTGRNYRYMKGLFRLETKDEFLRRVGTEEYSSPDRADADVMAFYPFASSTVTSMPLR